MRNHLVAELEAEARYQRERLALYRARAYGDLPTSAVRLRELERTSAGAEQRLRSARAVQFGGRGRDARDTGERNAMIQPFKGNEDWMKRKHGTGSHQGRHGRRAGVRGIGNQ